MYLKLATNLQDNTSTAGDVETAIKHAVIVADSSLLGIWSSRRVQMFITTLDSPVSDARAKPRDQT